MIGRNRRGNRQASMRARVGIATAVLVGGSAVGVAAVAAASHGSATATAQSAGFTHNINHRIGEFNHRISEQAALSSALSTWGTSRQKSLTMLTEMQPMSAFSQVWQHHTQLAVQRGTVVLATRKFLLVRSKNGDLHLWWITGGTKFFNVSNSQSGWAAMTGSTAAASAAMTANNLTPATTMMAGSTTAAAQLAAPVAKPTTIRVDTGTVTVTITIASNTATVTAPNTATTTSSVIPMTTRPTMTRQWNWTATRGVRRGDLVLVAGQRVHGFLIAKLVLFAAPNTVTPMPTATPTVTATPTSTATPAVAPTATSTSTFSGANS
ncbi:MAG TPA: hypothetical protein VKV38_07780 [Trebonia sp.]|nr:hypothetical protein [Trebonia sp.]